MPGKFTKRDWDRALDYAFGRLSAAESEAFEKQLDGENMAEIRGLVGRAKSEVEQELKSVSSALPCPEPVQQRVLAAVAQARGVRMAASQIDVKDQARANAQVKQEPAKTQAVKLAKPRAKRAAAD